MLRVQATYVGVSGFLMLCDARGWFSAYKIPRRPSEVPDTQLLWRTLLKVGVPQHRLCSEGRVMGEDLVYFPIFLGVG